MIICCGNKERLATYRSASLSTISILHHRRLDGLLNPLFRRRSKKASKLRATGLCEGNSPVTGEFPAQRTSNAKKVSIWWRHHVSLSVYFANMHTRACTRSLTYHTVMSQKTSRITGHSTLLNSLFRLTTKTTPKLRITGPLQGAMTCSTACSGWHQRQHRSSALLTGDPLHSRALAHSRAPLFTQPCPHCSHSRAPGEQWARLCVFTLQGCVQAARLCRGSPVLLALCKELWPNSIVA